MAKFNVQPYNSYTSNYFKTPYSFGKAKTNEDVVNLMSEYMSRNTRFSDDAIKQKRSVWDRVGDLLMTGTYTSLGFVDGLVGNMQGREGYNAFTAWEQAGKGFLAGVNYFGQGNPDAEYTTSKTMENAGWKPSSTLGKVTKGTVGFIGDVFLDPTTYLTGGVSAVVKGTGRTAKVSDDLAKFADDAIYQEFDNTVARMTEKGVSLERAEKYATKKMDEAVSKATSAPKFMTEDVAKTYIEYTTRAKGAPVDYKSLKAEAQQFATKYNTLRGIRDIDGGNAITFGVANMPFGQFVAPKMGVLGKILHISDGAKVRAFSDATKISTAYSRTRDFLYGSKVGKLFSTNHAAQVASRTNPEKFYEYMKYAAVQRGTVGNKLEADKQVRELARSLNISDADNKAILKALEDKTILSKVKQTIKFNETAKGRELAKAIEKGVQELDSEHTSLVKQRQELDMLRTSLEDDLTINRDLLTNLSAELNTKFATLKMDGITNITEKQQVVDIIQTELKSLDEQIAKGNSRGGKIDPEEINADFVERITNLETLAKENAKKRSAEIKGIESRRESLDMERGDTNKVLAQQTSDPSVKVDDKALKHAIDATGRERRIGEMDNVTDVSAQYELIETISEYAFGHKNGLPRRMSVENATPLVNMIKKGSTPEEVLDFILENGRKYSEHATQVDQFIAKALGYKDWNTTFVEPMKKMDDILKAGGELSQREIQERLRLRTLQQQRTHYFDQYYNRMNYDEFRAFRKELANQDELAALKTHLESPPPQAFSTNFTREDMDLDARDLADWKSKQIPGAVTQADLDDMRFDAGTKLINKLQKSAGKESKNVPNPEYKRIEDMFNLATRVLQETRGRTNLIPDVNDAKPIADLLRKYQELVRKKVLTGNPTKDMEALKSQLSKTQKVNSVTSSNLTTSSGDLFKNPNLIDGASQRIQNQVARATEVMQSLFPGKNYKYLTRDEKNLVQRYASSKKLYESIKRPEFKQGVADAVSRKTNKSRIETIIDTVRPGHEIMYRVDGKPRAGTVAEESFDEFGTFYTVVSRGEELKVYARDVMKVHSVMKGMSPDQLLESSRMVKSLLKQREETLAKLKSAEEALDTSKGAYNQALQRFVKEGHVRLNSQRRFIRDLEAEHSSVLDKISRDANDATINENLYNLERMQKALNDNEALEDWFKSFEGEEALIRYMSSENALQGVKIILDPRLDADSRAEEVYTFLRNEFDRMGHAEVGIGKLSKDQFDSLVGQYLPHMLTKEGKELIESRKGKQLFKAGVTTDLGYGVKFNPYSKSRELEGTVEEINAQFSNLMKGKNLFNESVSEIYLTRALKHNELMYDDLYMRNMMDLFGRRITDDVIEDGYEPVINIGHLKEHIRKEVDKRVSIAKQNGQNITEEIYEKFTASELHKLDFPPNTFDDFATPMLQITPEQLSKVKHLDMARAVDSHLVERANRARKMQIAKDQSRFLDLHDKFLHWVKLNQTSIMPHFHIRNKMSNFFQNWLSVGADAVNPRMQVSATKAVLANGDVDKLKALGKIDYVDVKGRTQQMGWDELWDLAVVHEVVDTGAFAKDIGAGAASKGLFGKVIPSKLDPTDTTNFIPYQVGMKVGSTSDNADRLIHMASLMRQGKTPLEAAESSKKFLFDYSDVTAFEQNVMKRILPYYTWLRKNGKLQAQQVIEQPGKYRDVAKVIEGVNGMNNQEDRIDPRYQFGFATDWVQLPQSDADIEAGKDPVILNPFLPYMDLNQIPDVTRFSESTKTLLAQTNPIFKVPAELMMNRSIFFDAEITHEDASTSENMGKILKHIASQNAAGNALTGLAEKEGEHLGRHIFFLATGIKTLSYDEDRAKGERIFEYYEDMKGSKVEQFIGGVATRVYEGAIERGKDAILSITPAKPQRAEDYEGALMPISTVTYDGLPEEQKAKYTPPTKEVAMALSKRAVELEEKAYKETGKATKFVWTLLDKAGIKKKDEEFVMARVTKVIDGDTFTYKAGDTEADVRVLLLDTPESAGQYKDNPMPFGKEASTEAQKSLFNKDVKLRIYGTDHYQRTLAFVEVDGEDFTKNMIEKSLGKVRYGEDLPEERDAYLRYEKQIAKQKKGIWSINGYSTPGKDTGFNQ